MRLASKWRLSLLAAAMTALLVADGALADTLPEAFASAYLGNATLRAARAGQRAVDEQVPQALSGWRPTVTLDGNLTESESAVTFKKQVLNEDKELELQWRTNKTSSQSGDATITLQQPLFRGFATVEGTAVAEAQVRAGRQNLLASEQGVLFSTAQVYMNVYALRQLVALQKENVRVLESELRAANERFAVGEITRTDVAQSRASLSGARGSLADLQAQLAAAAAQYLEVVGKEPGKLAYPKLSGLPASLKAALAAAAEINPSILAEAFVEEAAIHQVKVDRSTLLGRVTLQAEATATDRFGKLQGHSETLGVAIVGLVPLYEAGAVYSRVRQAKQLASQQRLKVVEIERAVRRAVSAAWDELAASRQIIAAAKDRVQAERLALDGVQQEYAAGTRTTQDVLDAQARLVQARAQVVNAERDQVIVAYQLLASVGRLTARDMKLKVPYYDPEANYRAVRGKWIGTGVETVE